MIIFITEQPYTFNLSGAAALSSSHLRLLVKKFPGSHILVIFLNDNKDFWIESPDFDSSEIKINQIHISETKFKILSFKSFGLFFTSKINKLISGIFKLDEKSHTQITELKDLIISNKQTRFIWCEHLAPVLYLFLGLSENQFLDKLVYSHHDFLFKILQLRAHSPRQLIRSYLVKRLEKAIIRKLPSFVSGSQFELSQIRLLAPGARQTELIPCFYPSLKNNELKKVTNVVKIYHIGTAAATANKIGLRFFFQKVFPQIENLPFRLEFFGNVKDYILQEFPDLINHPKIIFHGFVPSLEDKIEEGMIHVIPYSGMTGTRTRVAGIARFRPCLIGFKTIQDSYPFLISGKNVVLAENKNEFAFRLRELIIDQALRKNISQNISEDISRFETELLIKVKF